MPPLYMEVTTLKVPSLLPAETVVAMCKQVQYKYWVKITKLTQMHCNANMNRINIKLSVPAMAL